MSRTKETFLQGAFLLAAAALVSRLLGALYRIPLYPILRKEGMGLFQMAYPIYSLLLTLSTVGVNIAISKLVAEHEAQGDHAGTQRVFSTSLWLLGISGFILSVSLFAASHVVAERVAKDPRSFLSIAAISPAIFFVSLMSAYRGYFQGHQHMAPTALSQIIEQFVRVATMFLLALGLLGRGIEYAAAGATFGAVTGSIAGLCYLLWVFSRQDRERAGAPAAAVCAAAPPAGAPAAGDRATVSTWSVIRRIIEIAIPISLTTGILGLIQMVDLVLVPTRLQAMGVGYEEATALYGQLSGGAVPLMNMPTVVTAALQVSLVPAITQALATHDLARARSRTATALRLSFVLMVPAAVGLYVLNREIPAFLFSDPGVAGPLAALSSAVLFLSLQQTTSGALQGMGHLGVPVRNLLLGAIAKVVVTYVLTAMPQFGINGAAYGTVAAFLIAAALNLTELQSRLGHVFHFADMVLKPGLAVTVMGLAVRYFFNRLHVFVPSLGIPTLAAIALGAAVYGIVLLLLGGIRTSDVSMVPVVGPRLAPVLKRLGLTRE
ncbi:MAG: polysaccharide biosynthesis protein [Bacillota bacterium]|nr:polysaccharide biosynthesis protein [Bacillota bacterium]